VVFTAGETKAVRKASQALESDELAKEEQTELLRIARSTVDAVVRKTKIPEFKPLTERLKELRGVFVTLHKRGDLRGCIGYIEGIKPLYQAVADNAVSAATEDYRFPPVQTSELDEIDIEVTVLSPLKRTLDPLKDIVLGKHGIVVARGNRRGVFLPQVATETGWDKVTYLRQCSAGKAGLTPDAWKEKDCEVYLFTGQVFGERE
jgi:AmmeMemoRadiSam system protein A